VLNILMVDGRVHYGYMPARLLHRTSPTVERTFKDLSSSAVNKLDEMLLMLGMRGTTFKVR